MEVKPEEQTRAETDRLLNAAGCSVQDYKEMNLHAERGVALHKFPLSRFFASELHYESRLWSIDTCARQRPEDDTPSTNAGLLLVAARQESNVSKAFDAVALARCGPKDVQ